MQIYYISYYHTYYICSIILYIYIYILSGLWRREHKVPVSRLLEIESNSLSLSLLPSGLVRLPVFLSHSCFRVTIAGYIQRESFSIRSRFCRLSV